jgi:hypothetical protein
MEHVSDTSQTHSLWPIQAIQHMYVSQSPAIYILKLLWSFRVSTRSRGPLQSSGDGSREALASVKVTPKLTNHSQRVTIQELPSH